MIENDHVVQTLAPNRTDHPAPVRPELCRTRELRQDLNLWRSAVNLSVCLINYPHVDFGNPLLAGDNSRRQRSVPSADDGMPTNS